MPFTCICSIAPFFKTSAAPGVKNNITSLSKAAEAEARIKEINEAYEVLCKPDSRQQHDIMLTFAYYSQGTFSEEIDPDSIYDSESMSDVMRKFTHVAFMQMGMNKDTKTDNKL